MIPRIIFLLWLYRVFFDSGSAKEAMAFAGALPDETVAMVAFCYLGILLLLIVWVPVYLGILRIPGALHGMIMTSFVLLLAPISFVDFQFGSGMRQMATILVFSGIVCNCIAVLGNKGKMPVEKKCLERMKASEISEDLSDEEIFGESRHSLVRGRVRFYFFIDRFYYPVLVRGVFSVGDALLGAGILVSLFPQI